MINLYLLRHAKANSTCATGKDIDRTLSAKGIEQANHLKQALNARTSSKSLEILCSSAQRTQETLELILGGLKNIRHTHILPEIYHATFSELLELIVELDTSSDILLIGHNPSISELASILSNDAIDMSTCCWVHLSLPFNSSAYASQHTASLEKIWQPTLF